MSTLTIPFPTFVPGTTITSSQVNSNNNAIATWANTSAVQTDVAKTITVSHTWNAAQIFNVSGGQAIIATSTAAPAFIVERTEAAALLTHLAIRRAGVDKARIGLDASDNFAVTDASGANANLTVTAAGAVTVRNGLTVTGNSTVTGTLGGVTTLTATTVAGTLSTAAQPNVTSVGVLAAPHMTSPVVDSGGLTVTAGGATVTGNSTITGNLNVTGTISAVQGSSAYVRRATDVNFTTATDVALTFAIGTSGEWEFEYVLFHTNGSVATASFQITGPAASSAVFGGFATISGAPAATQGAVQLAMGNVLVGFTMNATAGYTVVRGWAKSGGTGGNVSLIATASAGTGVLKTGSFLRYAQIA